MSLLVLAVSATLGAAPVAGCAPIDLRDGRAWIHATINGIETEALLDSGAEMTVLDTGFATALDTATTGTAVARGSGAETVEARFIEDVTLGVGGMGLDGITVVQIDLSDVAERLIGGPLPMIVGREIFDAHRLLIDFEAGRLCAVSRDTEPEGVRMELTGRAGIMTLPVVVEGRDVRADFDTGNRGALSLSHEFAEAAGLRDGRPVTRVSGGGVGGAVDLDRLVVERLEIGGDVHEDVTADIGSRRS